MPRFACLFAHDHPSTPDTDWDASHGHVDGWAEWFEHLPLLFLYLIGDADHLPQTAPCAQYEDASSPVCLMAPMAEVQRRWQALHQHMESRLPQLSALTQAQWAQMHKTVTTSPRQWLVLDCACLCDAELGSPEMLALLESLRQRCAGWNLATATGFDNLRPLLDGAPAEWGWWSPAVVARAEAVYEQPHEEWPADLRKDYEPEEWSAWAKEVDAYHVRPFRARAAGECSRRDDDESDPVGLVTPYGRWLVHPDDGATFVAVQAGWISLHQPWVKGKGRPSGLKDINGQWVIPFSAGYHDLYPETPALAQCRVPDSEVETVQLLRLPDGELLFDNLKHAGCSKHDGLVRITHADDTISVLDAAGNLLFPTRYRDVLEFKKKSGLAIVRQHLPVTRPAEGRVPFRIAEGVVHRSGKLIVPCVYENIKRSAEKGPPQLYPSGKLLAVLPDGQPHVYNTKGALLSAPPCKVPCAVAPLVTKNQLFAYDGDGPDAQAVLFSLEDFSLTPTGETRAEVARSVKESLSAWLPKRLTMTRQALIDAEDSPWMRAVCRLLCHGDAAQAEVLLSEWREAVARPDPALLANPDDPDQLEYLEGETTLVLYWRHLLPIAPNMALVDHVNFGTLATIDWLPGMQDWHWEPGDCIADGLNALATHLAPQGLALMDMSGDGDGGRMRLLIVRVEDAAALQALLDGQVGGRVWWA